VITSARTGRTTALAYALAALALAAVTTSATLAFLNRSTFLNLDAADPTAIFIPLGVGVLGVLVARREPRNPTGWLLLLLALVSSLNGVEDQYVRYALLTHPGSLPGAVGVDVVNSSISNLEFPGGALALLLLLLPAGRLPSPRWRPGS